MAREIKKPSVIREKDLKEDAGPIEIDVSPRKPAPKEAKISKSEERRLAVQRAHDVASAPAPAMQTKTVTFGAWFQKKMGQNARLKLSYREALEAHCKSIGIALQATEGEYDAALAHFGL